MQIRTLSIGKGQVGEEEQDLWSKQSLHNLFLRLMVPIGENAIDLIIPSEYEAK